MTDSKTFLFVKFLARWLFAGFVGAALKQSRLV
jgi:hypothetical protein